MGVDIGTYRARIGTFGGNNGTDVVTFMRLINFSSGLKTVGSVLFIGILLIIAGIETNPGPMVSEFAYVVLAIFSLLLGRYMEKKDDAGFQDFYSIVLYFVFFTSVVIIIYNWIQAFFKTIKEKKQTTVAIVRQSFNASDDEELTLNEEDIITVTDKNTGDTTRWRGELNGRVGLFPKRCVEILLDEVEAPTITRELAGYPCEASCEVYNETELLDHDKVTLEKIKELGLKEWFPEKLTVRTLLTIDPSDNARGTKEHKLVDLPWIMLKRILSLNCDVMDVPFPDAGSLKAGIKQKGSLSALYENSNEIVNINPLDMFLIVLQCCDPMLKQLLFQKLYLCKLAVPFICHKFNSSESIVHIWPLRSIVMEIKTEKGRTEDSVLDMQTNVVCFARFGRPLFSKSKLISGILSNTVKDTFYNRECPSGTIARQFTDGYVDMFWLPTIGESKSRFDSSLTLLNMRGDMEKAFSEKIRAVVSDISDIFVAICGTEIILKNSKKFTKTITRYSFVILLITNPLDPKDTKMRKQLHEFENKISRYNTYLSIIGTHTGDKKRNFIDIIYDVSEHLQTYVSKQSKPSKSLETRLSDDVKVSFMSDENAECRNAEKDAESIVQSMAKASELENWVHTITPIQCLSKELSVLLKQQYRNKEFSDTEYIKAKINSVRKQQLKETTDTVRHFTNYLVNKAKYPLSLQYFLGWLKYKLERKKRTVLPKLMQQNQLVWDDYRKLKKDGKKSTQQVKEQERCIAKFERKMERASFGLENLFREVGHLCDAIICVGKSESTDVDLPAVNDLVNVIAGLVSNGYVFELLDGNSFYMPTKWIQLLLRRLHFLIGEQKVLALSVLGVQSSGKSTLLNTMFGSQYVVSSGRCTKGINAQLIQLQRKTSANSKMPFTYVLIIDTEGLRAPELSDRNYKRDNELSTIITGSGDMTILNIMGENTSEIRDILQITVHAFLRLKLVNENLDIQKSCLFIHQNVTDITACDKMKTGLQLLIRNLDSVTEESALSEGISDITAFNHVIEFDTESSVRYLPNLWQGNPPMARVNRKYSETAVNIRRSLVSKALCDKHKSFKTIFDIMLQTEDLWKGVLAEDFVFSFRNSLEKKAYIELEKKVKLELRSAENTIDQEVLHLTQNTFTQCDEQKILHEAKQKIIFETDTLIASHLGKTSEKLKVFFDDNNYIDTTIKWKEQTMIEIESYFKELKMRKGAEIDRLKNKREVDIMINLMRKTHEEELRKQSLELANELRNQGSNAEETDRRFEKIWEAFVQKSLSEGTFQKTDVSLKHIFSNYLITMFNGHPTVYNILKQHKQLHETFQITHLSGSFTHTKIDKSDISLKSKVRKYAQKIPLIKSFENSAKISQDMLENTFRSIDNKIDLICKKDEEIDDRDIKTFLHEVEELIEEIQTLNAEYFSLKITFKVKAFVHISSFACSVFEAENSMYQTSHGIKARLLRYKRQVKDRFYAHLNERKAEDTAALLFQHAIQDCVQDTVYESLSIKVKSHLREELPTLKYNLILDILTTLVRKQSFKSFMSYILTPKSYAFEWLTKMAYKIVFTGKTTAYSTLASEEICRCLNDIKRCMSESVTTFGDSVTSIEEWIQHFTELLKTIKLPKECFRDVVRELDRVENIYIIHFKDKLISNLTSTEKELGKEFENVTKETVRWRGGNPITEICEEIWGCPDHCVFCREPCIKSSIHKGKHICLQHRPSGCEGAHDYYSQNILIRSCNFDVASNIYGRCSYFGFKCNPGQRTKCKLERHPMRDYRKYFPDWDIEPSTDVNDTSEFWMWFIGKYKQDLGNYFKIIVTNVPESWECISEEDALDSLRKLYSRGSLRENQWLRR